MPVAILLLLGKILVLLFESGQSCSGEHGALLDFKFHFGSNSRSFLRILALLEVLLKVEQFKELISISICHIAERSGRSKEHTFFVGLAHAVGSAC